MPGHEIATQSLCEPAQSKCNWTCHKTDLTREFTAKMTGPKIAMRSLCVPAQLKCTWHVTRAIWREYLLEKCRGPRSGRRVCGSPAQSQEPFGARILRKKAASLMAQTARPHWRVLTVGSYGRCPALHDPVPAPMRRSCGNPGEVFCAWTCAGPYEKIVLKSSKSLRGPHMILYRSLWEDHVQILFKSFQILPTRSLH